MEPLKVGWVGAGFVGQAAHLDLVTRFPESRVTGLAELRPGLRSAVGISYGIPQCYSNHLELLEKHECQAVFVVVNRRHTFGVARDVLKSGRHLLTEKPMAQTAGAARELADIARERGLIYAVGFMRRHDDGVRKARALITDLRTSGELGAVISVRIFVEAGNDYCGIQPRIVTAEPRPTREAREIAPDWLPEARHLEYERFVNICSHDINLLRFIIPEVPRVTAVDYRPRAFSYALLDFGAFCGVFDWGYRPSDSDGWREGLEVRFEHGEVSLLLPPAFLRNVSAKVVIRRDSSTRAAVASKTTIYGEHSWAFEQSDRAFIRDVLAGSQPIASGEDSLRDFDIIDDVWRTII